MIVFVNIIYMGKYTASKRMSRQAQEELFINFAKALSSVRNSVEAANFIRDLLSEASGNVGSSVTGCQAFNEWLHV